MTIRGTGFVDGSVVTIGELVAEVDLATDSTLRVTVPNKDPGVYDITVTRPDGGAVAIEDGLEIFEDADGAVQFFALLEATDVYTEEEDFDSLPEGEAFWIDNDDVEAWAAFAPDDLTFEDDPQGGACTGGLQKVVLERQGLKFPAMRLSNEGSTIKLEPDGDGGLILNSSELQTLPWAESFNLEDYSYNSRVSFGISDFAQTPPAVELDSDTWSTSWEDNFIAADAVITTIEPATSSDHKLIVLGFGYDVEDSSIATIACTAADDGFFRLDADAWEFDDRLDWDNIHRVGLYIGRMKTTDSTLPHTKGIARVGIIHWRYLAGYAD